MARAPIVDLLLERGASHTRDPYLLFGNRVVTWGELAESSLRSANGLIELGVTPADRVAIMLDNSPEFISTYFGVLAAGAGTIPVNTAQRGPALKHILNDSAAKVIVVERHLREAVEEAVGPGVHVVARGTPSYDRLMDAPDTVPEMGEGESSGLGILYTSGTTGPPKGVVATGYDLSHVHDLLGRLNVRPGEVVYTALPLFHGNALILSAMGAVWNRWTLALSPRFSASKFWDDVRRYNAVETNALGAMIPILLKQPQRPDDADNPMRTVLSAACPEWAWREFEQRFGLRLLEFFGMVDYPGYLINDEGIPGKMGRALGATEFAVFDESGNPVPPGVPGELVMRHPGGRLTHYHNDPEATDRAYEGGWFHTGDLAIVDEAGRYTYAGRKKESMRRRGENVSAWEIETTVSAHPAVAECAAHSVASELGEDDIKLVVVLQPGAELTEADLADFCEGRMAHYALPSYIEFRRALPKTGTHRVLYETLKAEGITPETWHRPQVARGART